MQPVSNSSRLPEDVAVSWFGAFKRAVRDSAVAPQLASAADGLHLGAWTELLTSAVIQSCRSVGWVTAAKKTGERPLPVARDEYLGIDVMAFSQAPGWRKPVAAFELENSRRDDLVAYALWKACTVNAELSCLFCYRAEQDSIATLVTLLANDVLRSAQVGKLLVVVGTRASADTFPDGYFRPFNWDAQAKQLISLSQGTLGPRKMAR